MMRFLLMAVALVLVGLPFHQLSAEDRVSVPAQTAADKQAELLLQSAISADYEMQQYLEKLRILKMMSEGSRSETAKLKKLVEKRSQKESAGEKIARIVSTLAGALFLVAIIIGIRILLWDSPQSPYVSKRRRVKSHY